ncbi:hypothetical protein L210DRAFT_3563490 [Boletus edulis BED1]|uniref:Uncharacterized protein n=1 Tax=Boletus edulis BED1 TaxID=1328754 RepID=A0AAD4BHF5_BOLED|nr:hypothetical protein L210DRAFT_3563490 [Boletus edulis BED1]
MSSSISWQSRDESSRNVCPPCIVHQRDERSLEIDGQDSIHAAAAFPVDSEGKHITAADSKAYLEEVITCWKTEAANMKETIESFVAEIHAYSAWHEALRNTISTLESTAKELRTELPSATDEYTKIIQTNLEQDIAHAKLDHAELEQTITSVLTKIHGLRAAHEILHEQIVAVEDAIQELCAQC